MEVFGARAIEPPQEKVEPMFEVILLASRLTEQFEQFEDHPPEDDGIVGERRGGVGKRSFGRDRSDVLAHTSLDV